MKRRVFQVVDLAFGDSGKGTIVDYLCARHGADLNVRFNGGPQAGHNVVLPDGRHHTFAQFGSGMFDPFVRTLLSRFMLIEPYAMLNELAHLESIGVTDAMARTFVDERCRVITPPQQVFNRLRELARGAGQHGTCGMGVGECVSDWLSHPELTVYAADLRDRSVVRRKLRDGLEFKRSALGELRDHATADELRVFDEPSWIEVAADIYGEVAGDLTIVSARQADEMIATSPCAIYEGAQGVLLDEKHGFGPHTTWSTTTFANADALLDEAAADIERIRIGVMRSYMTRHGAGPLVTEDQALDAIPELHNDDHGWPGRFRRGVLDFVMLRYAIAACGGVDGLAITHLDRLGQLPGHACETYQCDGMDWDGDLMKTEERTRELLKLTSVYRELPVDTPENFVAAVGERLGVDVAYGSTGATRVEKREWLQD